MDDRTWYKFWPGVETGKSSRARNGDTVIRQTTNEKKWTKWFQFSILPNMLFSAWRNETSRSLTLNMCWNTENGFMQQEWQSIFWEKSTFRKMIVRRLKSRDWKEQSYWRDSRKTGICKSSLCIAIRELSERCAARQSTITGGYVGRDVIFH